MVLLVIAFSMAKVLLVDTNRASYSVYCALVSSGHDVWVVGGNPEEPLAKIATHYVQLDYSDSSKLASFVDEKAFHFIVPGCTDVSYKSCAETSRGSFPIISFTKATFANKNEELQHLGSNLTIY